jgi:hypothetical protein
MALIRRQKKMMRDFSSTQSSGASIAMKTVTARIKKEGKYPMQPLQDPANALEPQSSMITKFMLLLDKTPSTGTVLVESVVLTPPSEVISPIQASYGNILTSVAQSPPLL